jgi:hypothetical protein
MGLDMYLEKRTDVRLWNFQKEEEQFEVIVKKGGVTYPKINPKNVTTIVEELGYWRKANAIHRWFVENVQNNVDNCGEYFVPKSLLEKLLELCLAVKLNPEQADELLPTSSGFFFGGDEYDEWYFDKIEYTIEILKEALSDEDASYYYSSSW